MIAFRVAGACVALFALAVSPPPVSVSGDTYVNLNGTSVHAVVSRHAGDAAVVFESGLGEDGTTWSKVVPAIAKFATTVSYDRPGLGESAATSRKRDAATMAADLHELLRMLDVPPPYVLVGHSLGGLVIRVFAHTYPRETAALVFVDPVPEGLEAAVKEHMSKADYAARLASIKASEGAMPPAVRRENEALQSSGVEASMAFPLPVVPTILLTGTKKNPAFPGNPLEQDLKLQLHEKFLATIPHAMHVLVPESRHYIQVDQPGCVVDAITAALALVKSHSNP